MLLKNKNPLAILAPLVFFFGLFSWIPVPLVTATHGDLHCNDGTPVEAQSPYPGYSTDFCSDKGGVNVEAGCDDCDAEYREPNPNSEDLRSDCNTLAYEDCGITRIITQFINILTAVAGLVIVIMIVVGGVQYSAARDNPQATAAAKSKITNAILALAFFIFARAFLEYIVPGGLF